MSRKLSRYYYLLISDQMLFFRSADRRVRRVCAELKINEVTISQLIKCGGISRQVDQLGLYSYYLLLYHNNNYNGRSLHSSDIVYYKPTQNVA